MGALGRAVRGDRLYGNEIGPETGYLAQYASSPWPACVKNGVLGGTGVPASDSPIGQ